MCKAVSRLDVEISRPAAGGVLLRYEARGRPGDLKIPAPAEPGRADALWRYTCFEAFIGTPEGYVEVNLSPSRQWAVYAFTGYRSGMRAAAELGEPRIALHRTHDALALSAHLATPPGQGPWRLGLSAVIEETDGAISYWALAHPPGKPDFHHPDCFAAELPGA